jgi:serine/threonine protein kinase
VFLGEWRLVPVAIKKLKENMLDEKRKQDLESELEILSSLKPHPNIIQYLGFCESENGILIVTVRNFCEFF